VSLITKTRPYAERGLDAYFTPSEAIHALMGFESLPRRIFDVCCGNGAILNPLEAAGHYISGTDIKDYGWPGTVIADFLAGPRDLRGIAVVSNPPYRRAQEFIQKVIDGQSPYHAWLLRLNFLESMRRKPFFESHPPSRIWISSRRLPMMHLLGWAGPKAPSNHCFAWFVWDSSPLKMQVRHFDWRDSSPVSSPGTV
jgi:hypothetical protein